MLRREGVLLMMCRLRGFGLFIDAWWRRAENSKTWSIGEVAKKVWAGMRRHHEGQYEGEYNSPSVPYNLFFFYGLDGVHVRCLLGCILLDRFVLISRVNHGHVH
jgi:hypothetical protein